MATDPEPVSGLELNQRLVDIDRKQRQVDEDGRTLDRRGRELAQQEVVVESKTTASLLGSASLEQERTGIEESVDRVMKERDGALQTVENQTVKILELRGDLVTAKGSATKAWEAEAVAGEKVSSQRVKILTLERAIKGQVEEIRSLRPLRADVRDIATRLNVALVERDDLGRIHAKELDRRLAAEREVTHLKRFEVEATRTIREQSILIDRLKRSR